MSKLTEKEFFDEYDNLKEIENIVKKQRYSKIFEFLYYEFNHNKKQWITSKIVQERMGIVDRSNAYQILESFRVLNMLEKKIIKGKNAYYFPIHLDYWEEANSVYTKKVKGGGL